MNSERLTPTQWNKLRSSFDAAMAVPPASLQEFLGGVRQEDPLVGAELTSMLEANAVQDTTLESGAISPELLQRAIASTETDTAILAPGWIIQGRYEIEELIGEGGFGRVYRAADRRLNGRQVVVKILKEASSKTVDKRFAEELHALSKIDHPGIVSVTDSGKLPDGASFLVMQFVPGSNLRDILRTGPVGPRRAMRLVKQLLEALGAAHELGVLHRDIKPSNILVRDAGTANERAILIDFGIARSDAPPDGARSTLVAGTPNYMAPEQLLGRTSIASDIYSLGVVAFELCTGKALMECTSRDRVQATARKHLEGVRPSVPEPLCKAIVRAVAHSEGERFHSAKEFETALVSEPARRKWAGASIAIVLLVVLAAVILTRKPTSAPPTSETQRTFAAKFRRQSTAGGEPVRPGQGFHKGDKVEIRLEAQTPGHWYVLDQPSAASGPPMILLFPGLRSDRRPLQLLRIPENPAAWIDMDGSSTQERVWIVWSRENVVDLEEADRFSAAPDYGALSKPMAATILEWLTRNSSSKPPLTEGDAVSWQSAADPFVTSIVLGYR